MTEPVIFALDFDGVICDSAVETGITGWKAGTKLWPDMTGSAPAAIVEQFRQVRPIIETGYEAILTVSLLHQGVSTAEIFRAYGEKFATLMHDAKVTVDDLKALFGETRDSWIADDIDGWVNKNPLFDGVAEKLRKLEEQPWFVITTKQERFVNLILKANSINIPGENIFGLDRNLSKTDVLTELVNLYPGQQIYFVEDRLPTLVNVAKQKQLAAVHLVFADWGYNTAEDKATALAHGFSIQSLPQFLG